VTASTTTVKDRSTGTRKVLAAILAFALVSVFVIRTSNAAFTADHTNPDNEFYTAFIDLTGLTTPLFGLPGDAIVPATGMYPGSEVTGCLDITFVDTSNTLTTADLEEVELEVTAGSGNLAGDFNVTVNVLEGSCGTDVAQTLTGNLEGFGPTTTGWTPDGDGDARGFHFTVELDESVGNTAMNEQVTDVNLVWSVSTN
jgi:hypothetical protein